jgi:DNA end-binding protein Ku
MAGHRAQWKGFIKFGEVACGVGLYTAASTSERISFHTINRKTGNRVNRVFVDIRPPARPSASRSTRSTGRPVTA